MVKKILILIIAGTMVILGGVFLYYHKYQNLPEFAVSLLGNLEPVKSGETIVIFAPHIDDETLGCAGLIQKNLQNGAKVIVVFITNGDGHRFSSMEEFKKIYPSSQDYILSGITRQDEAKTALKSLGVGSENIIFFGYPDTGLKPMLSSNWQAPFESPYTKETKSPYPNTFNPAASYTGENLASDMTTILQKYQPVEIFASAPEDIHSDHAAAGEFIKTAVSNFSGQKPVVYFYLIHFRNYPNAKGLYENKPLVAPAKMINPQYTILKLPLSEPEIEAKQQAIADYKSQLKSPMLKGLMEGFVKQNEIFYLWKK